jgi:hypothetical protein
MEEKPDVLMDRKRWNDNELELVVGSAVLFQSRDCLRLHLSARVATVDVHITSPDSLVDS